MRVRAATVLPLVLMISFALPATGRAAEGATVTAARAYVASLGDAQRRVGVLPFDSPNRHRWTFLPGQRRGLSLRQLSPPQRDKALALVRTALSATGWRKLQRIFALESVLRDGLPDAQRRRDPSWRDPLGYTLTVFGRPDAHAPWGWRLGGHHVSLNVTVMNGRAVSAAPFFFGANPARVPRGPRAGLAPLADQERLARRLVASLDAGQRRAAIPGAGVPRGIVFVPGRHLADVRPAGLAAARLRPEQAALLWALVIDYAGSLAPSLAVPLVARAKRTDPRRLFFVWRGSAERGRDAYFRIQGPGFALEHWNQGNHIHSLWRDGIDEFGSTSLLSER